MASTCTKSAVTAAWSMGLSWSMKPTDTARAAMLILGGSTTPASGTDTVAVPKLMAGWGLMSAYACKSQMSVPIPIEAAQPHRHGV